MSLKTIFAGLLAALGSYFALMRLAYDMLPAQFIDGWASPFWEGVFEDQQVIITASIFTAISLFLGGWLSALWNKARNWKESLRHGASAGLIAGALSFNLVGAPWAGLLAQQEIYKNLDLNLSELAGTEVLFNAIMRTIQQTYSMIWLFILPSIFLGALGGLLFALDLKPEDKSAPSAKTGWLFRLPAYTLSITGIISVILMYMLTSLLFDTLEDMVTENNYVIALSPQLLSSFSSIITFLLFLLPYLLTIVWILRRWNKYPKSRFLSVFWILLPFLLLWFLANDVFRQLFNLSAILANPIVFFMMTGIFIFSILTFYLMWFFSSNSGVEKSKYSLGDWAGYALTHGILGGTQIFASSIALALSMVLVSVTNIPTLLSTPDSTVTDTPVEQIELLFATQQSASLSAIGAMTLIALLFGGITVFLRWVTGINRREIASKETP